MKRNSKLDRKHQAIRKMQDWFPAPAEFFVILAKRATANELFQMDHHLARAMRRLEQSYLCSKCER